ncbi:MAG TPA: FlgD immunoglobulin-like domain containing protein, partial [Candidatus Edwardsbacteria bacterium]|nr:FlgD immunoglobulin-like domain containing protein [Candidatus Edwardsbacteria bacterium]
KEGRFVYTGNSQYGVRFIDVTDPSQPVEKGFYKKDTSPSINFIDVVAKDAYLYASGSGRIMSFAGYGPAGCDAGGTPTHTNTTRPVGLRASGRRIMFDLQTAGMLSLDLYNVLGQHVRTIAQGFYQAGKHVVVWNPIGVSGAPIANGMYIIHLKSGAGDVNATTMILH